MPNMRFTHVAAQKNAWGKARMKRFLSTAFAAAFGAVAFSALVLPAAAAVLVAQPGVINGTGVTSSGNVLGYDDFNLPQADTVTSVLWSGQTVSAGTTFKISFSTDGSGSLPNLTPFLTETVTPTFTPYPTFTYESQFTAVLPVPVDLLANTDYWISIFNPNSDWEWFQGSASPNPGALAHGRSVVHIISPSITFQATQDLSFTLIGDRTATSVPEPASTLLFGTALAGLALIRRRNRA
jgi:hypothetical protein